MKKIIVSDFTLKNLAGKRKSPLLFREKTAIASAIDGMGVDNIELPAITKPKEEAIINKTISQIVKNAKVCIPVGADVEGVQQAFDSISSAKSPCLQVEMPVSTVQMEYMHHLKAPDMLEKIKELVAAAAKICGEVEFIAGDATRAEVDFLIEVTKAAVDCGATSVCITDEAGICMPTEIAELVKKIKTEVSVPLFVKVSNSLDMATASAFACIKAGADGIKVCIADKYELSVDKFANAVRAKGEIYGFKTGLDVTKIYSDTRTLLSSVNTAETTTDTKGEDIYLDADSTTQQISAAAASLGFSLNEEDVGKIERELARVYEKRGSAGAKELEAIIASSAMQAPSTYHLESYSATSSNITKCMAHVILTKEDRKLVGMGVGDGPIDAAFSAIEQVIGYHYELDDFQIHTISQGKESFGSALIKLRNNGKLYSGNGISTDIVGACVRAYINALNKIVYESEED